MCASPPTSKEVTACGFAANSRRNSLHSAGRAEPRPYQLRLHFNGFCVKQTVYGLRVYLKTPNAPGQRAFLRCAASFFLAIRQYSCEKMSCATQKSLAAGHIMSFQIHPRGRCLHRPAGELRIRRKISKKALLPAGRQSRRPLRDAERIHRKPFSFVVACARSTYFLSGTRKMNTSELMSSR